MSTRGWSPRRLHALDDAQIDELAGVLIDCVEGVRRADMPAQDGSVRSSAYYSIMRGEWPDVRKKLEDALAH